MNVTPPPPASRRRWLPRFGLRTLLILVAIFGVTFGYLGHLYRRVQNQRYIVDEIQRAGGEVRYNWQLGMGKYLQIGTDTDAVSSGYVENQKKGLRRMVRVTRTSTVIQDEKLPGHWIFRMLLGDDAFAYVERVDFLNSSHRADPFDPVRLRELPELKIVWLVDREVSDHWLNSVAEIPQLRVLSLSGNSDASATKDGLALLESAKHLQSIHLGGEWLNDEIFSGVSKLHRLKQLSIGFAPNVSSAIFAHIGQLKQLEELSIARCKQIEDVGTEPLSRLRNLRVLELMNMPIGDATLNQIEELGNLEHLVLTQTSVGDRGVQNLAHLSKLKLLSLSNTNVGDVGVEAISTLTMLRKLSLASTKITNACPSAIGRLTQLEDLSLPFCNITDDGIPALGSLTKLTRLTFGPHVTQEAAEKLHESIPACEIIGFDASGSSIFHLSPARRP